MRSRLEVVSRTGAVLLFDPASFGRLSALGIAQVLDGRTVIDALADDLRAGRALAVVADGAGVAIELFHEEEPPRDRMRGATATLRDVRLEVPSGRLQAGTFESLPLADRAASPVDGPSLAPGVYRADVWAIRERSRREEARGDTLLGVGCVASVLLLGTAIGLLFARLWWIAGGISAVLVAFWSVALVTSVVRDERRRQLVVVRLRGPEDAPPAEGGTLRVPRARNR